MPKRTGGMRLLEAPKPTLKAIQRRILHEILDRVPPHEAAHGFRSGRSILSHARAHAGRIALLRMDLEDFFISIPAGRVYGVFRTLGYPEEAARVLTGLSTSRSPAEGPVPPCQPTPSALAAAYRARLALPHASPPPRGPDIAVAGEPLRLWVGCPPRGRGPSRRRDLQPVRRRSRLLGRRGLRQDRPSVRGARRRRRDRAPGGHGSRASHRRSSFRRPLPRDTDAIAMRARLSGEAACVGSARSYALGTASQ
jgi:hypothetical protein